MPDKKDTITFSLILVLWIARGLSLLLFLLWGAFFIEHLQFFSNYDATPPFTVYLTTSFHFLLLASYIFAMWKHFWGSIMMITSALLFFILTSGVMFLPFFLFSVIPAGFYIYHWKNTRAIKNSSE
jgi:hypothetical protein